jgi:hypothetical protein
MICAISKLNLDIIKLNKMENNKFEFKKGKFGDLITFKGKELSREDILYFLNESIEYSDLVSKAEQMKKENQIMIEGAKGHDSLAYYKGIDLGIDRIIRLIKRNYG